MSTEKPGVPPDRKIEIAIVVEGGCVQDVFCKEPFEYEVFDYDNLEAEGMSSEEAEKHVLKQLEKYNPEPE